MRMSQKGGWPLGNIRRSKAQCINFKDEVSAKEKRVIFAANSFLGAFFCAMQPRLSTGQSMESV
jgi:hypothetical protein